VLVEPGARECVEGDNAEALSLRFRIEVSHDVRVVTVDGYCANPGRSLSHDRILRCASLHERPLNLIAGDLVGFSVELGRPLLVIGRHAGTLVRQQYSNEAEPP
jgi:hypothetical protein